MSKKKERHKRKKDKAVSSRLRAVEAAHHVVAPNDALPSQSLLEQARTKWQYGEWAELRQLDEATIGQAADREKVALLVAAAHSHEGDLDGSRRLVKLALGWGCGRRLAARVLASAVHTSLGRSAEALRETEDSSAHFESAIGIVEPRADVALLARSRRIREMARMGLLQDATALLDSDLQKMYVPRTDHESRLRILSSEIGILKGELYLAMKRNQLRNTGETNKGPAKLEQLSVSQLGQDLWVLERSGHKRGGYFVEFGATDGLMLSNTWLLEKEFGWTGICAEPNPDFFADLKKNRGCIVVDSCIGPRTGDKVEFILADEYGAIAEFADSDSHRATRAAYRADGRICTVVTISLNDLLERHGAPAEIDYLSIDTEGSEYSILKSFDFKRWKIRLISVEHNNTPMREDIRKLLEPLGYRRQEARWDDWYELVD